jgi:hypothetical protein
MVGVLTPAIFFVSNYATSRVARSAKLYSKSGNQLQGQPDGLRIALPVLSLWKLELSE